MCRGVYRKAERWGLAKSMISRGVWGPNKCWAPPPPLTWKEKKLKSRPGQIPVYAHVGLSVCYIQLTSKRQNPSDSIFVYQLLYQIGNLWNFSWLIKSTILNLKSLEKVKKLTSYKSLFHTCVLYLLIKHKYGFDIKKTISLSNIINELYTSLILK